MTDECWRGFWRRPAPLSSGNTTIYCGWVADVQLPAMLKGSIEAKQQAEQDALRMSFILQKEKQEAEASKPQKNWQ